MNEIGRLESVEVRQVWPHEERDFSKWLSQNLDLIGTELGIELRFVATEYGIGRFSLDILAHDDTNDRKVIIENQLGQTDHDHLGKLLTYAAGEDAHVVIWIARRFLDEHRAAVDWLNRTTDVGRSFFAIEVGAVKIGNSLPAPRFQVVSKPNDWQKTVAAIRAGSAAEDTFYYAFYEKLRNALAATGRYPKLGAVQPRPFWSPFRVKSNLYYQFSWSRTSFNVGLYIALGSPEFNEAVFRELEKSRPAIDAGTGAILVWDFKEGRQRQQVWTEIRGLENREQPETTERAISWAITALNAVFRALDAPVREALERVENRTEADSGLIDGETVAGDP